MRLSDAIRGVPGEQRGIGWESGALVTAVNTATNTITIRTADGATVDQVPHIGWWAPTVGERTEVLTRSGQLLALGPVGPTTVASATPVVPEVLPDPPAAPPFVTVTTIQPLETSSFATSWTPGLLQGGTAGDSRGYLFYGDQVAVARGAGTVTAATVMLRRSPAAHGVNGPANVRLGVHGFTDPSMVTASGGTVLGTWQVGVDAFGIGEPLDAVTTVTALQRGWGRVIALTPEQIAALNAGASGLGVEPGTPGHESPDNVLYAAGATGALSLTVTF